MHPINLLSNRSLPCCFFHLFHFTFLSCSLRLDLKFGGLTLLAGENLLILAEQFRVLWLPGLERRHLSDPPFAFSQGIIIKMAQHAHVPQFGNWENDDSIPYTQYFENARKGKSGGKITNPNDPEQTTEAFHSDAPVIPGSIPYTQYIENARKDKSGGTIVNTNGPEQMTEDFHSDVHDKHDFEPPKPKDELPTSKDDDFSQSTESHLHHSHAARKPTTDSPHHRHSYRPNSGDYQRRVGRASGGADNGLDRSPLHPHYQAKAANRGNTSSISNYSSESSYTINSSTPSRSRMRTGGRGDETPERGSAVPKFGEWDESNPSTADGYTHIFNQVRVEKQTGSKSPMVSNDIVYIPGQESRKDTSGCGCFGWFKK